MLFKFKKKIPAIVLFVFFSSLYVYTGAPNIHDGDSGEIATAINEFGLAHPTGFPLYMLAGKSISLFGGYNIARTLNILSSFFIATSVILLFLTLRNFNIRLVVALISAVIFGIGKSVWYHAGVVAVYPLSIYFITLLLFIFSKWHKNQQRKYIYWYIFVWALSFGTHLLMAILVFPLAMMVRSNWVEFHKPKFVFKVLVLFFIPFFQYFYLPIAYARNTLITFGSPNTFKGFLHYITQRDYVFKIGARSISDAPLFLKEVISLLINEHGFWFFWVGTIGLVILFKKELKIFTVLSIVLLANFVMMFFYGSVGDLVFLHRYLYPSYIIITIFLAFGMNCLYIKLSRRKSQIMLFWFVVIIGFIFTFRINFAYDNLRNNYIIPDLSHNIVKTVKENSILIVDGDSVTGPLWYFQSIGQGKDITIVNVNLLVMGWYIESMHKRYPEIIDLELINIKEENAATTRDKRLLSLIDKNLLSHSIYIAVYFSKNITQTNKFKLFPMGILYQVFSGDRLNTEQALEESNTHWQSYAMRNLKKNKNYSFQVNAVIKYYVIMLNNLGIFYLNNGQPKQALKYFEQAFTMDPYDALTNGNLKNLEKYL